MAKDSPLAPRDIVWYLGGHSPSTSIVTWEEGDWVYIPPPLEYKVCHFAFPGEERSGGGKESVFLEPVE